MSTTRVARVAWLTHSRAEMVENMERALSDQELTVEQLNLISVAYKNVISTHRAFAPCPLGRVGVDVLCPNISPTVCRPVV